MDLVNKLVDPANHKALPVQENSGSVNKNTKVMDKSLLKNFKIPNKMFKNTSPQVTAEIVGDISNF